MADRNRLLQQLRARTSLLKVLTGPDVQAPARLTAALEDWLGNFRRDDEATERDPDERLWWREPLPRSRFDGLVPLVEILRDAARWASGLLNAEADSQRYLDAAKARANLARASQLADPPIFRERLAAYLDVVEASDRPADVAKAAHALARLPVPVIFRSGEERSRGTDRRELPDRLPDFGQLVVKALVSVDGQPCSGTMIVRAGELHRVTASLVAPEWPKGASRLRVSYVSTLPAGAFEMEDLVLPRPASRGTEHEIELDARFNTPHGPDVGYSTLRLRAAFERPDGEPIPVPIIGSYELELRISDARDTPALERRPVVDARVAEIMEQVHLRISGVSDEHRRYFEDALEAVLAFQASAVHGAKYKGRDDIRESEFQHNVLEFLQAKLGTDDLRVGEKRAGGQLDIEYRSVTIELKVERAEPSVRRIFAKYTSQPTQYSSSGGQQLGIVLVLHLVRQTQPPGDLRNYLGFEAPAIHGFEQGTERYSTGMAVVIVPGNLRSPSDYSKLRRGTPTTYSSESGAEA